MYVHTACDALRRNAVNLIAILVQMLLWHALPSVNQSGSLQNQEIKRKVK